MITNIGTYECRRPNDRGDENFQNEKESINYCWNFSVLLIIACRKEAMEEDSKDLPVEVMEEEQARDESKVVEDINEQEELEEETEEIDSIMEYDALSDSESIDTDKDMYSDLWKDIYKQLIDDIYTGKELLQNSSDGFYYGDGEFDVKPVIYFSLYDIYEDGIPELFINPSNENAWCFYKIEDGKAIKADFGKFGRIHAYIPDTNTIFVADDFSMGRGDVYTVVDGKLVKDYSLIVNYEFDTLEIDGYYLEDSNGRKPITEEEFNEAVAEFVKYTIKGIDLSEENVEKYFN